MTAGAVHVKLNVISRMRKIGRICPSGAHSLSKRAKAKPEIVSVSMEMKPIKCFWSTFEREATLGKRREKKQKKLQVEMD